MIDIGRLKVIEVKSRKPARKHSQALVGLVDVYLRDAMGERRALNNGERKRLAGGLFRHPGAMVFLAEYCGEFIGLAVCFSGFSTFYAGKIVNIHDLVVLPEYRGMGVAGKILEAMENKARMTGCYKITLEVRSDNAKAMRLYRRMGFGAGEHRMYFWTKKL